MEYIQSRIELFHTTEGRKPTKNENETLPNSDPKKIGINEKKEDYGGRDVEKKLGKTAIIRRLSNYSFQAVDTAMVNRYNDRIFRASLSGDARSVIKERNQMNKARGTLSTIRQGVGVGITAVALRRNSLMAIYVLNQAVMTIQGIISQQQALDQYNELRTKEIFEASKRQNRIIVGTYNRRR